MRLVHWAVRLLGRPDWRPHCVARVAMRWVARISGSVYCSVVVVFELCLVCVVFVTFVYFVFAGWGLKEDDWFAKGMQFSVEIREFCL